MLLLEPEDLLGKRPSLFSTMGFNFDRKRRKERGKKKRKKEEISNLHSFQDIPENGFLLGSLLLCLVSVGVFGQEVQSLHELIMALVGDGELLFL